MKINRCIPILPLVMVGLIGVWTKDSIAAEKGIEQSSQIHLNKGVVYTIEGKKDPRLQATFLATYISTSKSAACSRQNPTTATRKVNIGSKRYPITEEHYRIEIPIYLEENENQCGYRFSRIELMLRRLYDEDLYSRHILLDKKTEVTAIYYGRKGGHGGKATLTTPGWITTKKHHFRIAKETQYICRTEWYQWRNGVSFYCFMRIKDGEGLNRFIPTNTQETVVTHPEFGIDEMKSETLQVDIFADDIGSKAYTGKETLQDHFRTIPKPEAKMETSQHHTMGERLMQWFKGLF